MANLGRLFNRSLSLFFLSLALNLGLAAQNWQLAPQFGLSASWGSHLHRWGLILRLQTQWQNFQLGGQTGLWYNTRSFGSQTKTWEWQTALSLGYAWGQIDSQWINPFVQLGSTPFKQPYALSYGYLIYRDQAETSQNSGFLAFQSRKIQFYFENDFLAFESRDRYRTGALSLSYQNQYWQFSLQNISFTGDPYDEHSPWIQDPNFPSRSGFIDPSSSHLGHRSAGILALQIQRFIPWPQTNLGQTIGLSLGCDAEQIRNTVQNKWIHDSKILPINWGPTKNPHIPMLCQDGCPYLYHQDQKLRQAKLYFQLFSNPPALY